MGPLKLDWVIGLEPAWCKRGNHYCCLGFMLNVSLIRLSLSIQSGTKPILEYPFENSIGRETFDLSRKSIMVCESIDIIPFVGVCFVLSFRHSQEENWLIVWSAIEVVDRSRWGRNWVEKRKSDTQPQRAGIECFVCCCYCCNMHWTSTIVI